jgi:pyruvate,water dikinase
MAISTSEVGAFPSPFSIETPAGCEGWEEMYPYWALFDEHRKEADENRLWFWNSMHFPLPMPAFDMCEVDVPYFTFAGWQNRAFAVPPAMGVDYRVVNGYVYISPNPVTDPDLIAERAEFFQKRAGYYFSNWDELYVKWREKMEALNREV